MNGIQMEGSWKRVTRKVKEKWGQLSDEELTEITGKQDQLADKLQDLRQAMERVHEELDAFAKALK